MSKQLHDAIMALPLTPGKLRGLQYVAYEIGHRDARHAAAELALADGWLPIESAPVATPILVVWRPIDHESRPFHKEIVIGCRCFDLNTYLPDGRFYAGGVYYDEAVHVTVWQQLPALPAPPRVNPDAQQQNDR